MAAHIPALTFRSQPKRPAWRALENHCKKLRGQHLRDLFAGDPGRGERLVAQGAGIYLDYSKNRVTDHTIKLLVQLADESGIQARIDAMFRGEKINTTQKLPALHVALRAPRGAAIFVDGENVVPQVQSVLDKMTRFSEAVRRGDWKGQSEKRIRNVINIAAGGFDMGPAMAYHALKDYSDRNMRFRFVSNFDASDFADAVHDLDPLETLFIICSEHFDDPETIANARAARAWVAAGLGEEKKGISRHFVAVTSNGGEAASFGIDSTNVFPLWEWVGERYSISSATGLSTMMAIGAGNFRAMLDGCHQMDMHFLTAPFDKNLPVLLGLLTVWYVNFLGVQAVAVLPYAHRLRWFPEYLGQLAMGSNGRHVTVIGTDVTRPTSPVYSGEVGTRSQHSFCSFLHQGTMLVPCDLIVFGRPVGLTEENHDVLAANAVAEAEILAFGKESSQATDETGPEWLCRHRVLDGNHPSSTILADKLTPETLGKLIALYEHSVFTQAMIWNINSFDGWYGQVAEPLSQRIITELGSAEEPRLEHDSSTNALIRHYRRIKTAGSLSSCQAK